MRTYNGILVGIQTTVEEVLRPEIVVRITSGEINTALNRFEIFCIVQIEVCNSVSADLLVLREATFLAILTGSTIRH
jgi:hypothetical protein